MIMIITEIFYDFKIHIIIVAIHPHFEKLLKESDIAQCLFWSSVTITQKKKKQISPWDIKNCKNATCILIQLG